MKLQKEFNKIFERFERFERFELIQYKNEILQSFSYRNKEIFLSWKFLRLVVGYDELCNWYKIYNCNDNHIETLALAIYKKLGI